MGRAKPALQPNADPAGEQVFEHPLTERMRSFLRMEAVLAETRERMTQTLPAGSRATLASLLELMALTERGELKREILTELDRQRVFLAQLTNSEEVDSTRLNQVLYTLEQVQKAIERLPERLGQNLKSNEFLSSIRSRSAIPGGTCAFDLPALHCWLARPASEREEDLERWMKELAPVEEALAVLLRHIREAAEPQPVTAAGGIYEYSPPSENPPSLLRITLPIQQGLFPLVSAGKHRVTIQFQRWNNIETRPETLRRDVAFTLAVCRL